MASNSNEWTSLPQRKRSDKRTRDNKTKLMAQLKEMFGSTFESEIIETVADHCQYKLEAAIETLITLSSQTPSQTSNPNFQKGQPCDNDDLWQADDFPPTENPWFETSKTEKEFLKQEEELKKFEAAQKCNSQQRNLQDINNEDDKKGSCSQRVGRQARKVETASLCGLKVQYRPKGIDYKSDDDADVVIEDEASDYKVEPEPISVCNFLANTTQCPPRTTFPKMECISTPSPPCTPRHQLPSLTKPLTTHEKHLQRIQLDIKKGWKILIILRGCPGSGKSYLAQSIVNHTMNGDVENHIFSADHYFSLINGGVYRFDHNKLSDAHAYCQNRVYNAMRHGVSPVIVDNTNTQAWEMKTYAVMGVENGYIIETVEPDTHWFRNASELAKRNQHGVPQLKIQTMLDRYESQISGERLIRMFRLVYPPYNRPPQPRKEPPILLLNSSIYAQQENVLSTIAKEYANLETLCKDVVPNPPRLTPMLSIEGNSFKEEDLIDLTNLGAIGSERKISNDEEKMTDKNLIELPKLGAIGSERKLSMDEVIKDDTKETAGLVDTEVMTKLLLEEDKTEEKLNTSGALQSITKEDYFLDAEENVSRDSNTSKNSATSSDHSTDFEKVDMIDFDSSPENKTTMNTQKKETTAVGLGSLFSYIKNSFLGIEKEEPVLSPKVENEEVMLQTSMKTNSVPIEQVKKEIEETKTSVIQIDKEEHDTLSTKLSSSVASDVPKNNLTINVQESVEVVNKLKNNNEEISEELLEACLDFQLIETIDYSARREEEDNESIISEKSFAQELKNLQAFMKFQEDDARAANESIDTILNDKNNILKDQQNQNLPRTEVSSDDDGIGINNINLINWRESPLPVEHVQNLLEKVEDYVQVKSDLHDKETFTDPYDFNVVFIGSDEFKVIEAHNRSINERNTAILNVDSQTFSGKQLHKSTMTNDLLHYETMFDLEVEHRGEELIEKFPHIPRYLVLDVYDNLCRRDFNWAAEYLKNLESEDVAMAIAMADTEKENTRHDDGTEKNVISLDDVTSAKKIDTTKQGTSSTESSNNSPQYQPSKHRKSRREKNVVTQELECELQKKFVFSEESYPTHTLRVKRWKNRDFSPKKEPEQNVGSFDDQLELDQLTRHEHPAAMDNNQASTDEESSDGDSGEEMMELKLGYEFIRVLEAEFGNPDFSKSDGLFPVIQIKKSMAQELHALWIDSMQQQLWSMQEQLDSMIAKDAEYARALEAEEDEEFKTAIGISEPEVPNLKEIMDMEMALAVYSKDSKKYRKDTSKKQMENILTTDILMEMFPYCDRELILAIYDAHDRDFSETVKVIKENCDTKCKLTMADVLKKRKHLIDKLHKESLCQTSKYNEMINEGLNEACGGEYESNQYMTYEDALQQAHESRSEAQYQLALRDENFRKAKQAYRNKNPQVAAYYSDVAKLHIRNVEAANSAAASAFLAAQAHTDVDNLLDLHYLHVAEAREALNIFIDHQLNNLPSGGRKHIFIITGRGLRSLNGQSRIKPAVAQQLNAKNLRFSEVNPGMLKVQLRKK